jgi:hypothetical protein
MRTLTTIFTTLAVACLIAAPCWAGQTVRVTFTGKVEYNQINPAPLGNVGAEENVTLTFLLDSDDFVDSPSFPTRGYAIAIGSFSLAFDSATLGLQKPFPPAQTPYFVLRDNDPAVDGFLVSTSNENPIGVPIAQPGIFGQFINNTYVTYGGGELSSLDILGALGSYDFSGLTVYNWTVDDGPFNPLGVEFQSLVIELEDDAWTDMGSALAGVSGDPSLVGSGDLSGGSVNSVELSNAAPNAAAGLFIALASTPVPFKGGTLMPFPFFDPLITATSGTGGFDLPFVMPAGVPVGTELWVQWAIQDSAAIAGISLSNAVMGLAP